MDDREVDPVQPDFVIVNLPTNLRLPRHAFAFALRVGGHAFQLNFSNGFGTTYSSLARGASQKDWFIGFNLSRKFY